MDVFELTPEARAYWRAAAIQAARELGVFEGRTEKGVSPARLRRLEDVLALERATADSREGAPSKIAEVLRSDRPLAATESLDAFHRHLLLAGALAARELADHLKPRLPAGAFILDLGGGGGVYSEALLERLPGARSTLVDRPEVLALAPNRPRQAKQALDLLNGEYPVGCSVAILANVLHLFGPADAARIVAKAAAALASAGLLAIKDLRIEEDRSGPPAGVYFALNMALYTEAGDVHPRSAIESWLRAAGLSRIELLSLRASPDAWAFVASRA